MPNSSKRTNQQKLLVFFMFLAIGAGIITAIIEHVWLGGVIVGERIEDGRSFVQIRENRGTWVEVSNFTLVVFQWAKRISFAGILGLVSISLWSWLRYGHLPTVSDE